MPKLFCENLKCLGDGDCEPHIHLVCPPEERKSSEDPAAAWAQQGLPIKAQELSESFVTSWLRRLLKQDAIHTFDSEILLKPWQVPRIAAPLAALIFIFALYGIYQSQLGRNHGSDQQAPQSSDQSARNPVETHRAAPDAYHEISGRPENLSEFNREDYQLLELLSFLTQLTPDDTWLNYLSLRKGQLILRGESKSAIKYLAELSKTEGLTDVKFASPVTRDPGTDQERFNVQLQLDMEKLKKSFETLPPETPGAGLERGARRAQGAWKPKKQRRKAPAPTQERRSTRRLEAGRGRRRSRSPRRTSNENQKTEHKN